MSRVFTLIKSTRLLLSQTLLKPTLSPRILPLIHTPTPPRFLSIIADLRAEDIVEFDRDEDPEDVIDQLLKQVDNEIKEEREIRKKQGLPPLDNPEDDQVFIDTTEYVNKVDKQLMSKHEQAWDMKNLSYDDDEFYEEPTDSSDDDLTDIEEMDDRADIILEQKLEKHGELVQNLREARSPNEKWEWIMKIDEFEEKHLQIPFEYKVIGELMSRLDGADAKEKFMLIQKLNRAMKLMDLKEANDPNNPDNFEVIKSQGTGNPSKNAKSEEEEEEGNKMKDLSPGEGDGEEFDFTKERDAVLLEKLNDLDKKLETKLAELDFTFGKKGKILEQEIKDLAEERRALAEKKRTPLGRKGYDARLISVNRTTKVTKGGRIFKCNAIVVCGNYQGTIGYAKAKGLSVSIAVQKAYEKSFQNLHFVDLHEEHTIPHAVQTSYKKSKIYLWPAAPRTGMRAGRDVETILVLAGYKNVRSKLIGSRNPYNTVKAVFKALASIKTPKDISEEFGRTVVDSHLL